MLNRLDAILTAFVRGLERFQVALGRAGDYVIQLLSRYVEALLRILRRAGAIIFRFLRDLVANLLKIAWQVVELSLVAFFFVLVWGFGNELRRSGHIIVGVLLEAAGVIGVALFAFALLASLARSVDADQEASVRRRGRAAFMLLDSLAVLIVVALTVGRPHWFGNRVLRGVQILSAHVLVLVTSGVDDSGRSTAGKVRRAGLDAICPAPLRAGRDVTWPTRVKAVEPEIPRSAFRADAFDRVELEILLGGDGRVRRVLQIRSAPLIDHAVIQAVWQWEYAPTVVDSRQVPVIVPVRYRWPGLPIPKDVVATIRGSASFVDTSVVNVRLENPTKWVVGLVRLILRSPKDRALPVRWERRCDIDMILNPGDQGDFRCRLDPVDRYQDFRWDSFEAWGIPPRE